MVKESDNILKKLNELLIETDVEQNTTSKWREDVLRD